jgi:nucleotide-binding universal stress UspA family protein
VRGDPASLVTKQADEPAVGLIVMASHGRSGLERFALGSVAEHVVHAARIPVVVIRPFGPDRDWSNLEHALVPLDGSALAELALPTAAQFGGSLVSMVTLARVVDPILLAGESDEAARYLEEARSRFAIQLGERQCRVETTVLYGSVAEQILERAQTAKELIVMATHGRTGASRWTFGSVAERVLHETRVPLLLVHPRVPG